MAVPRYHFDLYPRDDPKDGTRLVRFTNLQTAKYRAEANGVGVGEFSIRATDAEAQFIDPRGLQYVRVVEEGITEDERVVGGFWLETGDFAALTEDSTKLLKFGGPGTLAYLSREVLWSRAYNFADDNIIDSSGTWHFYNQTSLAGGDFLGAVLWRVMAEAQSFASPVVEVDDKPDTAIPESSTSFGQFNDSAANLWTVPSGEFKAQVGDSIYSIVKRLMEAGLYVEANPDTFVVNAWERGAPSSRGQDKTGSAWATDVLLFKSAPLDGDEAEGNIKSDAKRSVTPFLLASTVLAGDQGVYAAESNALDVKWHRYYASSVQNTDTLSYMADSQLSARGDAADTLRIRMKLGTDPTIGEYIPLSDYEPSGTEPDGSVMLNDLVTVHTGTSQWDFNEDTFPVSAITISVREGGDWDCWLDLGAAYSSMAERAFQARGTAPHSHPPNPGLCPAAVAGTPDVELYHLHWANDLQETVAIVGGGTGPWPASAARVVDTTSSPGSLADDADSGYIDFKLSDTGDGSPELPATAGTEYRFEFDTRYGGGIDIEFKAGTTGLSADRASTHTEGMAWIPRSFTITAPPTADRMIFKPIGAGHYAHVRIFEVGSGTEAQNEHNGVSPNAARCDHTHPADDHDHDDTYTPLGHGHLIGDLADVDLSTPPTDGQVLTYDLTSDTWLPDDAAGGAHDHDADYADIVHAHGSPSPGFHGVLVQRTTDFTAANSNDSNPDFDTEVYDTDGAWTVGAPKIFTVPASWDGLVVQVGAWVGFETGTTGYAETKLYRNIAPGSIGTTNDDKLVPGGVAQHYPASSYNTFLAHVSAPFPVAEGDTLTIAVKTAAGHDAIAYEATSILFGMWIVEPGEGGGAVTPEDVRDAGRWEVVVSGTAPPVALTNEAEDDWLYAWVPGP